MVAILTAIAAEAEHFIKKTEIKQSFFWNGNEIYIGIFGGKKCVITHTGIGKVHSAIITTHIIDIYKPEAVLYTGIAGALRENLRIGDVIIARDCVQWDVDATPLGYRIGEFPNDRYSPDNQRCGKTVRFYETDPELTALAGTWNPGGFMVKEGRIITGDSFFDSALRKEKADLLIEMNGDAVEMEGATAATAARISGIPFFLARVISDTTDGKRPKRFRKFTADASFKMAELVEHIFLDY